MNENRKTLRDCLFEEGVKGIYFMRRDINPTPRLYQIKGIYTDGIETLAVIQFIDGRCDEINLGVHLDDLEVFKNEL